MIVLYFVKKKLEISFQNEPEPETTSSIRNIFKTFKVYTETTSI